MKYSLINILLIFLLLLTFSCTGRSEKSTENPVISTYGETSDAAIAPEILERGLKVYKSHCFACHMLDGNGVKGIYPPLAENSKVIGDKPVLIGILLNGMSGEIEVKGEKFNQIMIPHDFLSDKQIADVLTYIRNSFGNEADEVKPSEVKAVRGS